MAIYTFPLHSTNTTNTHKRSKMRNSVCIMSSSSSSFLFQLLAVILLLVVAQNLKDVEAQNCQPGTIRGTKPPPGQCNTENDSECCVEGRVYTTHRCSPPVSGNTRATLTLNSFRRNGDGGGPSECDERYHPDDIPVVALSTGWFNRRRRCNKYITIRANGRSVRAMVVDECDSKMGCDAEHDYQPPCHRNIVDGNNAVWGALGVPRNDWGQLDVEWSDA